MLEEVDFTCSALYMYCPFTSRKISDRILPFIGNARISPRLFKISPKFHPAAISVSSIYGTMRMAIRPDNP